MISGVPSFCAAAAELGEILCEDTQNLEIIPFFAISPGEASGEPEDKFRDSSGSGSGIFSGRGTKVLMKPGKNYPLLKDTAAPLRQKIRHDRKLRKRRGTSLFPSC